jgi:dienelactone hydrolase
MDFTASETSHGVVERRFELERDGHVVPGLLWTPEGASGPRPLVLVGHGGTSHKRSPYVLSLARRLVRHAGYAVAAIDAPHHGDRAQDGDASLLASPRRLREVVAEASGVMTDDWTATYTSLQSLDEVGAGPLGYWGLSMGTMLGLPFVAATPDIRCAVLGLMGILGQDDPWTAAAPAMEGPVLFLVQTDDELVPVDGAVGLFRAIGASDKRMHAHPGAHSAVPVEEMEASEAFFARHLAAPLGS